MILYIISQRLRTDGRIYFRYGWESGIMKRADSLLYMGKGGGDIGVGLGFGLGPLECFPV